MAEFWIIKVCCTTVGETFADYMADDVGFSSQQNLGMFGGILFFLLACQFFFKSYIPVIYWLCVVFMSVEGTLITDGLTDNEGLDLWKSTLIFASLLVINFALWVYLEGTIDIHSIYTPRREVLYWLSVFWTFALGTAFGDLISEALGSFANSLAVFACWLIFVAICWKTALYFKWQWCGPVFWFWSAYILTRPLGASIGDLVSQDKEAGGWGLGTTTTSSILAAIIIVFTLWLQITKRDQIKSVVELEEDSKAEIRLEAVGASREAASPVTVMVQAPVEA